MINNLHKFKYKSFLSGNIILINADCEAVMAEIGDKEIDLVLTDPPYGIDYGGQLKGKGDGRGGLIKMAGNLMNVQNGIRKDQKTKYFNRCLE